MTFDDLLWIPADSLVAWFWYWWLRRSYASSRSRVRAIAGFIALLLVTLSAALFTFAIAANWATGYFTLTSGLSKSFYLGKPGNNTEYCCICC